MNIPHVSHISLPLRFINFPSGFLEDNPDGLLSKKRMVEMYQDVLSWEKAKVFVDQIFGRYDKDNSGNIDFKVSTA